MIMYGDRIGSSILGLCCMMFMAIKGLLLKRDCRQTMTRSSFRIERERIFRDSLRIVMGVEIVACTTSTGVMNFAT